MTGFPTFPYYRQSPQKGSITSDITFILNLDLVVLEPNFIREDSALVNNQTGSITIIQSKEEIQGVLTTTDWCNWH
jgi:hypothetical protein